MPRLAVLLIHLFAVAGGTYAAFRPTFDSGFARVQTSYADTMFNHYVLEHEFRALTDPAYCGTFLSPPIFHPQPLVLGYSETLIGVAPLYWLLRIGLPDHLAYQWWMILLAAANYPAAAVVLRRAGVPLLLAVAGGYLWAFALPHLSQLYHQQTIARVWMPPAIWLAWRFAQQPTAGHLNRMFLCLLFQAATCVYSGFFLAFALTAFLPLAVTLLGQWRTVGRFLTTDWRRRLLHAAGWAAAAGLVVAPQMAANVGNGRLYSECVEHLPTPSGWFASLPGAPWYETIRPYRAAAPYESLLFAGFGLYAAAVVAVVAGWKERRTLRGKFVLASLGAAALIALLTLNLYEGASGWWLVRLAPGGLAIRAVGRVGVAAHLLLVPGALVGVWAAAERWVRPVRPRTAIYLLAGGLMVFEQTGADLDSAPKADFYPVADRLAAGLRGADVGYIVPPPDEHPDGDVLAMWAGLRANVPVVNGYSGRFPQKYPTDRPLTEKQVRAWLGPGFRGRLVLVPRTNDE